MKPNKNKRGVSTIVITVIMVALVLAAVGVVWVVVNNLIGKSAGEAEIAGKCLSVDVKATLVTCTTGTCDVTLERTGTGDDEIAGVALVFRDSNVGTSSSKIDEDDVAALGGDIEKLVGETVSGIATGLTTPDKVEVTVYFKDAAGKQKLCQTTNPFEF